MPCFPCLWLTHKFLFLSVWPTGPMSKVTDPLVLNVDKSTWMDGWMTEGIRYRQPLPIVPAANAPLPEAFVFRLVLLHLLSFSQHRPSNNAVEVLALLYVPLTSDWCGDLGFTKVSCSGSSNFLQTIFTTSQESEAAEVFEYLQSYSSWSMSLNCRYKELNQSHCFIYKALPPFVHTRSSSMCI